MDAPWTRRPEDLLSHLAVDEARGLTEEEARRRRREHGPNALELKKRVSRAEVFLKQFKNPMVVVLIVAAAVAFSLGEALDGWAIVAIVLINTLIGFVQEYKAEASIEALAALSSPKAKVLRAGTVELIPSEEVCLGDILVLEAGDFVPADARIIAAHQLAVDEAILTGESLPVEKSTGVVAAAASLGDRKNMLFASTALGQGSVKAVVVAIGKNTEVGKIAQMISGAEAQSTPLQHRLEIVGRNLLVIGVLVILLVAGIGAFQQRPWVEVLMSALSLSIAAIPEGLPTVVTIALVMAVRRMSQKKALVRKMGAVETLGATTVICTDKTGTLTTGKMEVRETFAAAGPRDEELLRTMVLCNNAGLENGGTGDSTEIALLEHARKRGVPPEEVRLSHPRVFEWSFESDRKRMSVASREGEALRIHTKGAPEAILAVCDLSESEAAAIAETVSSFSRKGMRVLGYATKNYQGSELNVSYQEIESGLRFLGLSAMADPPRVESKEAIHKCQRSGIRVLMITGDHPQTAGAIAYELGITTTPDARVLTGVEIDALSEEEFRKLCREVSVYARVSPANKLRLVEALKAQQHVVAMTGDGVNDAPALKVASIGVAMGKGGTEVARQASSMVLTDDNFATIVDAVEEGRAVNGNIKRTLQYLLSTNLAELLFILSSIICGWPVPLLPVNLLWLNLVSDGLPSLALAAEKVPAHFLYENRKPSGKDFFDRSFYRELLLIAAIITAMSLAVYQHALGAFDLLTARSFAFTFLVYAVLLRSFSCRSDHRTFFEMRPNAAHLLSVAVPIGLQFAIQRSDFLLELFKIHALSFQQNLLLLALGAIPVTLVEVYKLWSRR